MFDLPAKLLSSLATFLFPVFASYKALKGNDPGELAPWLMYWVVLACLLLVESWCEWILVWFPFYAWIRAGTLLYLVLPQTQGARLLYQTYINPFLTEHEADIDRLISSAHDRVRDAGVFYFKNAIEYIRVNVLGLQPRPLSSASTSSYHGSPAGTYTQNLLARFYLPSARQPSPHPSTASAAVLSKTDIYNLVTSVLGAYGRAGPPSNFGQNAPPSFPTSALDPRDERVDYITHQRERLKWLLQVLDKEAASTSSPNYAVSEGPSGQAASSMRKNRSEADFENVEREDIFDERNREQEQGGMAAAGISGWMPWNWASGAASSGRAAGSAMPAAHPAGAGAGGTDERSLFHPTDSGNMGASVPLPPSPEWEARARARVGGAGGRRSDEGGSHVGRSTSTDFL